MFKYLSLMAAVAVLFFANAQTKPATKTAKSGTTKTTTKSTAKPAAKSPTSVAKPGEIKFTVNGKLEGYPNYQIRLYKFHYNNSIFIDSVFTNDTGGFTFKNSLKENSILYVQYSTTLAVPLIVENGAVFNLVIHTNMNGLNYELNGTKCEKSNSLYDFLRKFSRLNGEMNSFESEISKETDPMKSYSLQMYAAMKQQELQSTIDTMLNYKSPLEGYFVFFAFVEDQQPSQMKNIFTRMEPKDIKSKYYTDLKDLYNKNKGVEIGEIAPDIDLPQTDGSNLKLSSLRGKYVLIDFWASWCGPCRAEFPNVKRVYEKYKSKGFEIYGVSLDRDKPSWTNSINSLGLPWKHVSDLKYWGCAPVKVYKVSGIPFTVLLDKEGRVIAKNLRGAELEKKLEELFK